MHMAPIDLVHSVDAERLPAVLAEGESLKALDRARQAAFWQTADQARHTERLPLLSAVGQYCMPVAPR